MLYTLPTGRTIRLTLEEYLDLTDQDIQYLCSRNSGGSIHNPFYDSVLSKSEDDEDDLEEEAPEEDYLDIPDAPSENLD